MATYRMQMSFTRKSMTKVVKQLTDLKKVHYMKVLKVTRLTAETLVDFIADQYQVWNTGYIGSIQTTVRANKIGVTGGYQIVASGPDIYFLEFGTGVFAAEELPEWYTTSIPIGPGSYSLNEGQGQFIPGVKEWWYWGHQWINGSAPAFAFAEAHAIAPEKIAEIVKEVFG